MMWQYFSVAVSDEYQAERLVNDELSTLSNMLNRDLLEDVDYEYECFEMVLRFFVSTEVLQAIESLSPKAA